MRIEQKQIVILHTIAMLIGNLWHLFCQMNMQFNKDVFQIMKSSNCKEMNGQGTGTRQRKKQFLDKCVIILNTVCFYCHLSELHTLPTQLFLVEDYLCSLKIVMGPCSHAQSVVNLSFFLFFFLWYCFCNVIIKKFKK